MNEPVTYLGLDIGAKRIGVARGNSVAKLASPLKVIDVNGRELAEIGGTAAQEQANVLVVGLPRGLDGQETPQTKEVRRFGERLKELDLKVYFQDEAGTSKQAEAEDSNRHRYVDDKAAAIILQDFLDNLDT